MGSTSFVQSNLSRIVTNEVVYARHYARHLGSRCDIFEKPYKAYENEVRNPTSAISEDELEEQVPLLLLCPKCREELKVFPLIDNQ